MLRSTDYIERLDGDDADALAIEEWLQTASGPLPPSAWEMLYDWAHENEEAWLRVRLPDDMTQSVALSLMASRAPLESRFNANHDKAGRFATSPGSRAGFREMDLDEARTEAAMAFMKDFGSDARISEETAASLAARQLPQGTRVFARDTAGTTTRVFVHQEADVDNAGLDQFMGHVGELQQVAPVSAMAIKVQPAWKFTQGNVLGETVIGHGNIRFSDRMFHRDQIKMDESQTFHPKSFYSDPMRQLTAHEWGHAVDHADKGKQTALYNQAANTGMSRYGRWDAHESYAEAFSDWFTSPPDKWMGSTAAYVDTFGWGSG